MKEETKEHLFTIIGSIITGLIFSLIIICLGCSEKEDAKGYAYIIPDANESNIDIKIQEGKDRVRQLEIDKEVMYKENIKNTFVSLWALEEARKDLYPGDVWVSGRTEIGIRDLRQITDRAVEIEKGSKSGKEGVKSCEEL